MVFTNAKDAKNPIVYANQAFLDLTGWDRSEVLGESFNSLMARGASPEALKEIESAVDGRLKDDPEICYRRKDGNQFWASISISPVRDQNGVIVQGGTRDRRCGHRRLGRGLGTGTHRNP